MFPQEYGLVQGGVLSPLLFNVAIDSIFDTLPHGIPYAIYADDCTLWAQETHAQNLFQRIQDALKEVGKWSRINGFTFSPEKSSAILFRRGLRRLDMASLPMIALNNVPITVTDCVKYLDVWFDSKLNLHAHVEYTKARA